MFRFRNDVPQVAQRYGTIAALTRRRASVLVVFVMFCVHMYSFAGLIRRTPPPTFSDTAITNRHFDTINFQLNAHWCGYPGLLDRKNRSDMCPLWESNHRLPACKASTLSTRPGSAVSDHLMHAFYTDELCSTPVSTNLLLHYTFLEKKLAEGKARNKHCPVNERKSSYIYQ